jgi:uncharacterized membrane protein
MAGIYFTFSVFIMKSFSQLPEKQGADAMNKINDVIVNTLFLPVFFLSTLWYAGLIVWSLTDWKEGESVLIIVAALIYIVGMFLITAFGNVPMNNQLKNVSDDEDQLVRYWRIYLRQWTRLNHVRTVSCMAACAFLCIALI